MECYAAVEESTAHPYWCLVLFALIVLIGLRSLVGVAAFSLAAWVYNISHFVKAGVFFSGTRETKVAFYSPVISFAWFTLCLFQIKPLNHLHVVFAGILILATIVLATGGWRLLASGAIRLPLLTMFLLGETLVWASYSPYMTMAFRVGVYVFHIAAAGFYHYLTAYFYAESSPARNHDLWLRPSSIFFVNAAIFGAGLATGWLPALRWLRPIFGTEWFTLWVALHLVGSDLFSWLRQLSRR